LQEKYGYEMEICYGIGYDWRNAPIDGQKGSLTVISLLFSLSVLMFHSNALYIF
jgi:hypothetical protein